MKLNLLNTKISTKIIWATIVLTCIAWVFSIYKWLEGEDNYESVNVLFTAIISILFYLLGKISDKNRIKPIFNIAYRARRAIKEKINRALYERYGNQVNVKYILKLEYLQLGTNTEHNHQSKISFEEILSLLFSEPTNWLLEANAGYGKTYTLLNLVKEINKSKTKQLAFYLELGSYKGNADQIENWIINSISTNYKINLGEVEYMINHSTPYLFLDGLDEFYIFNTKELYEQLIISLNKFIQNFHNTIIVGSRPLENKNKLGISNIIKIEKLNLVEVHNYLNFESDNPNSDMKFIQENELELTPQIIKMISKVDHFDGRFSILELARRYIEKLLYKNQAINIQKHFIFMNFLALIMTRRRDRWMSSSTFTFDMLGINLKSIAAYLSITSILMVFIPTSLIIIMRSDIDVQSIPYVLTVILISIGVLLTENFIAESDRVYSGRKSKRVAFEAFKIIGMNNLACLSPLLKTILTIIVSIQFAQLFSLYGPFYLLSITVFLVFFVLILITSIINTRIHIYLYSLGAISICRIIPDFTLWKFAELFFFVIISYEIIRLLRNNCVAIILKLCNIIPWRLEETLEKYYQIGLISKVNDEISFTHETYFRAVKK